MAIYTNFNQINDYMKIASGKDSCWICAKKKGAQPGRDAYDTLRELEGAVENKPVIVIRRSGIDTCICMDCIKEVYDEHIAPTLKKEEVKNEQPSQSEPTKEDTAKEPVETPVDDSKEEKKTTSKGKKDK